MLSLFLHIRLEEKDMSVPRAAPAPLPAPPEEPTDSEGDILRFFARAAPVIAAKAPAAVHQVLFFFSFFLNFFNISLCLSFSP